MPALVENLADLTALRDRQALDTALVASIRDLLSPISVAICRVVGESEDERWRVSAKMDAVHKDVSKDAAQEAHESLPPLSAYAMRQRAVLTGQVQESQEEHCVVVFPLSGTGSNRGILEICTAAPLPVDSHRVVAGILRLYSNFSALLDYGERDSLTELLNRKTFDSAFFKATLEQQVARDAEAQALVHDERRSSASNGTYWLAMIDIDHFKQVNDNFGHLIGDEVLLLLARLMRSHFRFHDQIYRFGGEEFVVLIRCHTEAETIGVLERLRTTTQNHPFPQVGSITISVGFSEVRIGDSPSSAIERADKAVYYAKGHGRNQVCSYEVLVSSGQLIELASNVGDVELF